MKLVTNLNPRRRWVDPVSGISIKPNATISVTDEIAEGVYFYRAANLRKPRLIIVDAPKKKTSKKNKPASAALEG